MPRLQDATSVKKHPLKSHINIYITLMYSQYQLVCLRKAVNNDSILMFLFTLSGKQSKHFNSCCWLVKKTAVRKHPTTLAFHLVLAPKQGKKQLLALPHQLELTPKQAWIHPATQTFQLVLMTKLTRRHPAALILQKVLPGQPAPMHPAVLLL